MGVFDEVGKSCIQVKCTPDPTMRHYAVGERIPLADGLYLGYEGWFAVRKGRVLAEGADVYDKWGTVVDLREILDLRSDVVRALQEVARGS